MTDLETAIGLLLVAIALALFAQRLATPRPIVLAVGGVVVGLAWHLVPGVRAVKMSPELILALFLPPVLTWAAYSVPLGAFRSNLRWILLLVVGLVLATALAAAAVARALEPALPLAAALALGALIAPPDSVAATSVAGRLGLRNRLVIILEGEGLMNDATSIILYNLAIAVVVKHHFSWGGGLLEFVRDVPVGVAFGLAVGWIAVAIRSRISDPVLETAFSLIVPYVAYLVAEWVDSSAVLAVVAFGLYLRRRATEIGAPASWLVGDTVWRTVSFMIEGLVFLLIGVELGSAAEEGLRLEALWQGAVISVAIIAVRMAWMHLVPRIVYLISSPSGDEPASSAERTVLGWAGMRGVVSLALALAIPTHTFAGTPFPERHWLITVAFVVVFVTLIVQGLTLAPLIRWLGVGDPGRSRREERAVRRQAVRAAAERLEELARRSGMDSADRARVRTLLAHHLGLGRTSMEEELAAPNDHLRRVLEELLIAERDAILELRHRGQLSDDVARELEHELNLDLLRLHRVVHRHPGT